MNNIQKFIKGQWGLKRIPTFYFSMKAKNNTNITISFVKLQMNKLSTTIVSLIILYYRIKKNQL
jgi:hypothetical protein